MTRRVVLCGGGHSHVLALPYLMRHSPPDVEWILVSDSPFAPYSGMLPGFIAGQFSRAQCLIDLRRLCLAHRIIWRQDSLTSIENGAVRLSSGNTLPFDVLSVNVGGVQQLPFAPEATRVIAVKPALPLMDFVESFPSTDNSIAVVGSGAGGCEIAMALRRRLPQAKIQLIGKSLLPDFNASVQNKIRHILQSRNIHFCEGVATASKAGGRAFVVNEKPHTATHIIFALPITPFASPNQADKNKRGIAINEYLQSTENGDTPIFAAGDCAESGAAKSGVVAVRQAPVLAHNIIAMLNKTALRAWRAKKHFLYILNTADGRAIANWGRWSAAGVAIWTWKKYLDLRFMRQVTDATMHRS